MMDQIAGWEEAARLRTENDQLRAALGYPVPGDTPEGNFKCGLCEAKEKELIALRAVWDFALRILQVER